MCSKYTVPRIKNYASHLLEVRAFGAVVSIYCQFVHTAGSTYRDLPFVFVCDKTCSYSALFLPRCHGLALPSDIPFLPLEIVRPCHPHFVAKKGFDWYRAWIVRCHQDDTFDVRFTRPPVRPSDDTPPVKGVLAAQEQRPEVDTSSQVSGSEEEWDNTDGEEVCMLGYG